MDLIIKLSLKNRFNYNNFADNIKAMFFNYSSYVDKMKQKIQ